MNNERVRLVFGVAFHIEVLGHTEGGKEQLRS
jgi:hypothetical protein